MSVESSIRYGNEGPHRNIFNRKNAQHYGTPDPFVDRGVDWRLLDLWEQENPNPNVPGVGYTQEEHENFEAWFEMNQRVRKVCWAQFHFPNLHLMDWMERPSRDEDLDALIKLVRRHICSVCGRADDPGCTEGC